MDAIDYVVVTAAILYVVLFVGNLILEHFNG